MDDFLIRQKFPILTHEIENLSGQITRDKTGNMVIDPPL